MKERYEIIKLSAKEMEFYEKYSQHKNIIKGMKFMDEIGDNFIEKYNKSIDKSNFYIVLVEKKEYMKQEINEEMEYDLEDIGKSKIDKIINRKIVGISEYEYIGKYPNIELKREYYTIHKEYQNQGLSKLYKEENRKIIEKFISDEIKKGNNKTSIYLPDLDSFTIKGYFGTKSDTLNLIKDLSDKFPHIEKQMNKKYNREDLIVEIEKIDKVKEYFKDEIIFIVDEIDDKFLNGLGIIKRKSCEESNKYINRLEYKKLDINSKVEYIKERIKEEKFIIIDKNIEINGKEYNLDICIEHQINKDDKYSIINKMIIYDNGQYKEYNFKSTLEIKDYNLEKIKLDVNVIFDSFYIIDKLKKVSFKELDFDINDVYLSGILKEFINKFEVIEKKKINNFMEIR